MPGRINIGHKKKYKDLLQELFNELSSEYIIEKKEETVLAAKDAARRIQEIAGKNLTIFKNNENLSEEEHVWLDSTIDDCAYGINKEPNLKIQDTTLGKTYRKLSKGYVTQASKSTATIIALSLGYMGWDGYYNKEIKILNAIPLSKSKGNEMGDGKESFPALISAQDTLSEIENIEKLHNSHKAQSLDILERIYNLIGSKLTAQYHLQTESNINLFIKETFHQIVSQKKLENSTLKRIEFIIEGKEQFQWYHNSVIASALTISNYFFFTEKKTHFLIKQVEKNIGNSQSSDVWQKALVGIVLGLLNVYRDISRIYSALEHLKTINRFSVLKEGIFYITENLINHETNRVRIKTLRDDYFNDPYYAFCPFFVGNDIFRNTIEKNPINVNTNHLELLLEDDSELFCFEKYFTALNLNLLNHRELAGLINKLESEKKKYNQYDSHLYSKRNKIRFSQILDELFLISDFSDKIGHIDISLCEKEAQDFIEFISRHFDEYLSMGFFFKQKGDLEGALASFNRDLKINKERTIVLEQIGETYIAKGDFRSALSFFKEIEKSIPKSAKILEQIGLCLMLEQEYNNAIKYLQKAKKIEEENISILVKLAYCQRMSGDNKNALNNFKTARKHYPENAWIYENIGLILQNTENYVESLKFFKIAQELNPKGYKNLAFMGISLREEGNYEKALSYFKQANKIAPQNTFILFNVGLCFDAMRNQDDALKIFMQIVDKEPNEPLYLMRLAELLISMGEHKKALSYIEKVEKIFPNNTEALNLKGRLFFDVNDYKSAVKVFKASEQLTPLDDDSTRYLGFSFLLLNKIEEALIYLQKIESEEPFPFFVLEFIGDCLEENEHFEKAIEYFNKIEKIIPQDAENLKKLVRCNKKIGNYKNAIKTLTKLLEIEEHSDNWVWFREFALCLQHERQHEKALDYFIKAEQLNRDDEFLLMNIGYNYFILGKVDLAKKYYSKIESNKVHHIFHLLVGLMHIAYGQYGRASFYIRKYILKEGASQETIDFISGTHDVMFEAYNFSPVEIKQAIKYVIEQSLDF